MGKTLNECSIVFVKYSSTVVEAASIGVIPVILDSSLKFEKKIDELNYDPPLISRSIDQIKKTITILYNNNKKRGHISKKISNKFRNHINYFGKRLFKTN